MPNQSNEPRSTIDLSPLPVEVRSFLDAQLHDRLAQDGEEAIAEARAIGDVDLTEDGSLDFYDYPLRRVIRTIIDEKLNHMEQEIMAGDRDDWTLDDVEQWRDHVDAVL
jgi:hypothetical protein